MNKAFFRRLVLPVLLLFLVISYLYADQQTSYSSIEADYHRYSSVQELVEDCALVISGYPVSSRNYVTKTSEGYTDEAYTITELRVSSVKKTTPAVSVKEGQTIQVVEPTYLYDRGVQPGKIRFSIEGYQQMHKGSEYLLFLTPNYNGEMFLINGLAQGKYNIDGTDDQESLDLSEKGRFDSLKREVKALYGITD